MRIIGGIYKGRKLNAPELSGTRPTTDLARESLFNILQHRIDLESARILDLFSGTGSIAFECLSRGAASACCVDQNGRALRFIRETAKEWNCEIETVKSEVVRFIGSETRKHRLIFADPPYQLKNLRELPGLILQRQLLEPEGLLVLEHGKESVFSGFDNFVEERVYGHARFSFFEP